MDKVHLHRKVLAIDSALTRGMEVELYECVGFVATLIVSPVFELMWIVCPLSSALKTPSWFSTSPRTCSFFASDTKSSVFFVQRDLGGRLE